MLFALVFVACGPDYDTPTREDYDEMADAIAVTTSARSSGGNEVAAMTASIELSTGVYGAAVDASYDGTVADFSYAYAARCFDTAGLDARCDGAADGAQVDIDWDGALDLPRYQLTLERQGSWQLDGLQSGRPEFNGTGSFRVDSRFTALIADYDATYVFDYQAEYDGIGYAPEQGVPIDGQIRYELDAERRIESGDDVDDARFLVDVTIDFLGNGQADLILDGDARYVVDLRTGDLVD
ncbi:MAG: hypothetical protein AAFV53_28840 [Myxococcota bacterium]